MPSPFPGMDPFLEGNLWPDVHQALADKIRQLLVPRLRPRYVARLALAVLSERPSEEEISIMYPDVEVVRTGRANLAPVPAGLQPEPTGSTVLAAPITAAPFTVPFFEMRVVTVEVLHVAQNELVTTIEILSPINKREPGLTKYLDKVISLHAAGVHVLEIDLLRRGTRAISDSRLRDSSYLVALTRALGSVTSVWPLRLQDKLPVVPVPLRAPDPDVPLNLSDAFSAVYDEAAYDLSINYRESPPPPPLSAEDEEGLKSIANR